MTRLRLSLSVGTATAAVAVLGLSVPAPALADPSEGRSGRVDVGAARNRIDLSVDVGAARNRIDLPADEIRRLLDEIERGTATSASTDALVLRRPTRARVRAPEKGPGELLQTALGLTAASIVLSGAALVTSQRRRSTARPVP